jgi:hypothetical protein
MTIKLNVDLTGVNTLLDKAKQELDLIANKSFDFFVKNTPVRSGNARRNTRLVQKKTIVANYPYAERLDEGYSRQSPKGMTEPTQDYIQKTLLPAAVRRINRGK